MHGITIHIGGPKLRKRAADELKDADRQLPAESDTEKSHKAKKRGASAVSGLKKAPNRRSDVEREDTLAKTTKRRKGSPGAQTLQASDQTTAFDKPHTGGAVVQRGRKFYDASTQIVPRKK